MNESSDCHQCGHKIDSVLVWGVGLIGRSIVRELDSIYRVVAVDKNPNAAIWLPESVDFYTPSSFSPNLLEQFDAIIWSAGVLSPEIDNDSFSTDQIMRELERLFSSGKIRSNQHFILVSSLAVYQSKQDATESSAIGPSTKYGNHKLEIEGIAKEAARKCGFGLTILRPCGVLGELSTPGGGWMQALFRRFVESGGKDPQPLLAIRGQEILHSQDLAQAVRLVLEAPSPSLQLFNVGSGVVVGTAPDKSVGLGLNWNKIAYTLGYVPRFATLRQILEGIMTNHGNLNTFNKYQESSGGPRIMIISGSHRTGWYTSALATEVVHEITSRKGVVDLIEVSEIDLPMHNPQDHNDPHSSKDHRVRKFAERVQRTDAFVWISPIYHGSYSSGIKRVIDHLNITLMTEKPVCLMVHGGGRFGSSAIDHMRSIAFNLHARVINTAVATNRDDFESCDSQISISNTDIQKRISRAVGQLFDECEKCHDR